MANGILVGIGAICGVLARVIGSDFIKRRCKGSFPLATFLVNMLGSHLLGILTGIGPSGSVSLLLETGFLGSFTTFSTFNVENIELLRKKKYGTVLFYAGGSYAFGIILFMLGIFLGIRF